MLNIQFADVIYTILVISIQVKIKGFFETGVCLKCFGKENLSHMDGLIFYLYDPYNTFCQTIFPFVNFCKKIRFIEDQKLYKSPYLLFPINEGVLIKECYQC